MKIPVQDKIAELERRLAALETERRQTRRVIDMTGSRMVELRDDRAWTRMWSHFDAMFSELGKVFR